MHTVPALNNDDPYHRPTFIAVDYRDEAAVNTVSTRLREAWITDPALIQSATNNTNPDINIGTIIRAIQSITTSRYSNKDSADALSAFRNADKNTLHTGLRDAIYHNWNHVFWDVARFLRQEQEEKEKKEDGETAAMAPEAGGAHGEMVGHLHPPAEEVFALEYPKESYWAEAAGSYHWMNGAAVMEMEFEVNALLVPTFVEAGVKVEVAIVEGEEVRGFTFDATATKGVYNEPLVYWIRKGKRVRIFLSGDVKDRCGVAAVFVYGKLCDCSPARESEETDTEQVMSIEDEVLEEK